MTPAMKNEMKVNATMLHATPITWNLKLMQVNRGLLEYLILKYYGFVNAKCESFASHRHQRISTFSKVLCRYGIYLFNT